MKNKNQIAFTVFTAVLAVQVLSACGPTGRTPEQALNSGQSPTMTGGNIAVASAQSDALNNPPAPIPSNAPTDAPPNVQPKDRSNVRSSAPSVLSTARKPILRSWSTVHAQSVVRAAGDTLAGSLSEGVAFYTFETGGGDRQKIHSCETTHYPKSNFLSLDANCEGQRILGDLGYAEPKQRAGTQLLVRCFHPVRGQHLAVTNANIGECLNQGFKMEVGLGWVPASAGALIPVKTVRIVRGYHPGKRSHVWNHSEAIVASLDYRSEGEVFKLFANEAANRQALFLCQANSGYFVSTYADCEGVTVVKFLGYASRKSNAETPATLYRCLGGPSRSHLIAVGSPSECAQNGYKVEVILGYASL